MPKPQRVRPPDPTVSIEVAAPRTRGRRVFSAAEKQRILDLADACGRGELGALLRREGIYHSHLTDWRVQLARGGQAGLVPRTPGPAPKLDAKDREIAALNSKLRKLEKELAIVNGLVELQKKCRRCSVRCSGTTRHDGAGDWQSVATPAQLRGTGPGTRHGVSNDA